MTIKEMKKAHDVLTPEQRSTLHEVGGHLNGNDNILGEPCTLKIVYGASMTTNHETVLVISHEE